MDENGFAVFIVDRDEIPVDQDLITIASDFMEIQNSFRSQAMENPNAEPTIDENLIEKFSDLIEDIKEKKSKSESSVNEVSGWDWILPEAFAWSEVCGGAPWNPQPEPPVYQLYASQGAANYLINDGYHLVAFYATGYGHPMAMEIPNCA